MARLPTLHLLLTRQGRGLNTEAALQTAPEEGVAQRDKPWFAGRPSNGQRLREVMRHRGGVRLRGGDAAHGEVVGSCLGFIKQFHKDSSQKLTS